MKSQAEAELRLRLLREHIKTDPYTTGFYASSAAAKYMEGQIKVLEWLLGLEKE